MTLVNEAAATACRVLDKCCAELEPTGAWRWRCVVQNGGRLPLTASLGEGFLQLAGHRETLRKSSRALERALVVNGTLAGNVKLALNAASRDFHMRTDVVLLGEQQLLDRVQWALVGFHHGYRRLKALDSRDDRIVTQSAGAAAVSLGDLLHETSWPFTERGPNDFSAELEADSAPPARITMNERGLVFSVELVRSNAAHEVTQQALAVFLLTASSALRLVRARVVEKDGHRSFGFQVCLPAAPAAEEIDHALAALSVAYRMCAREANVLLDEAAARCYLTARDFPTTQEEQEKEN